MTPPNLPKGETFLSPTLELGVNELGHELPSPTLGDLGGHITDLTA